MVLLPEAETRGNPMKRLGSLALLTALSALGAAGCGANTTAGGNPPFLKFDPLADFEKSAAFNMGPMVNNAPLWSGSVAGDADKSDLKGQPYSPPKPEMFTPPRTNPDGSVSTQAYHAVDGGYHTEWGSVIYADLQSSH